MKRRFDTYGWTDGSLEEVAAQIEQILNLTLEARESYFLGGDYYLWKDDGGRRLSLQPNAQDDEGNLAEQDRPELTLVLYAVDIESEILERLESISGIRLRSELI